MKAQRLIRLMRLWLLASLAGVLTPVWTACALAWRHYQHDEDSADIDFLPTGFRLLGLWVVVSVFGLLAPLWTLAGLGYLAWLQRRGRSSVVQILRLAVSTSKE